MSGERHRSDRPTLTSYAGSFSALRDFLRLFRQPAAQGRSIAEVLVLKRKAVDDAEKLRRRSVVDVPDRCRSETVGTGNKVRERARVWSLCEEALRTFFLEGRHPEYDSLAITSDFRGSPHVDRRIRRTSTCSRWVTSRAGSCASRLARVARRRWRWT